MRGVSKDMEKCYQRFLETHTVNSSGILWKVSDVDSRSRRFRICPQEAWRSEIGLCWWLFFMSLMVQLSTFSYVLPPSF